MILISRDNLHVWDHNKLQWNHENNLIETRLREISSDEDSSALEGRGDSLELWIQAKWRNVDPRLAGALLVAGILLIRDLRCCIRGGAEEKGDLSDFRAEDILQNNKIYLQLLPLKLNIFKIE